MLNKLIIVGVIFLIITICYSLVKQTYDSLRAEDRVNAEKEKLVNLQEENLRLKNELEKINSLEFIESQARDRLNFSRANETVVIISQDQLQKILGVIEEKRVEKLPSNWQGWLRLFWR